ncbi:flagellar protein FlaG [Aquibacillus koreensis]|uniref:Flagellar protein FlaG n=1 Tax=Aquibacillus koreensis TaxID=279446 RepID=A0A9X3WKY2_9BACI|nr:flagellar protein FlaG [Aquibacillus koreensis]MCT2537263.1 flagellar protein FlaG [Aquibacillus koreensis]MDC3421610.1 flagellar protein FlaG [Aquibacillus koreensis]
MNVGKIISGSQLLQRAENIELSTSARERSVNEQQTELYQTSEKKNQNYKTVEEPNKEEVKSLVDSLNKFLEPTYTNLKFEFHEKLERYYVTIVDPESKEIIKEIPPKKLLDVYASMAELMGFIVDEKV